MESLKDEKKALYTNATNDKYISDEDHDSTTLLSQTTDIMDSINDRNMLKPIVKLDSVVEEFKIGLFHYSIIAICGFCYCSYTLFYQAIAYIIVSVCDLQIKAQNHQSWLSPFLTVGVIIGSGIGGVVGDLIGRRIVIIVAISINLLAILATAFAVNLEMMIIFVCINGLAFGAMLSNIHPYSIEFFSRHSRGWAIACVTAFSIVGSIFGSMVAVPLIHGASFFSPSGSSYFISWRLYLLSCSLPVILGLCLLVWMPNSLRYTLIKGDNEKISKVSNRINKINSILRTNENNSDDKIILIRRFIEGRHTVGTDEDGSTCSEYVENIKKLNQTPQRKRILLLMIAWFGYGFTSHGLWVWLPSLLSYYIKGYHSRPFGHYATTWERFHKVPINISLCLNDNADNLSSTLTKLMVGNILSLPVTLSCILIICRDGRRSLFCCLAIVSGIFIFLIWLIDHFISTLILVCTFSAFSFNGWIPFKIWSSELFITEIRSTTFGLLNVFAHFGILCGATTFEPLFHTSSTLCLILYSLAIILSGIVALFLPDTTDADIG